MEKLTFDEALEKLNRVYNVTGYSEFRMNIFITRMFSKGEINAEVKNRLQILNNDGAFAHCVLSIVRYEDTEENPITCVRTYDMYGNECEYSRDDMEKSRFSKLFSRNVRNYNRNSDGSLDMFII